MLSLGHYGRNFLEVYAQRLLGRLNWKRVVLTPRHCIGTNDPSYSNEFQVKVGGCKDIKTVHDMVEAAKEQKCVLYRFDEAANCDVIDFIYQNDDGYFSC
jgi:hypothetical protein